MCSIVTSPTSAKKRDTLPLRFSTDSVKTSWILSRPSSNLEQRVATAEAGDDPRYRKFVVEGSRSDYRGSALVRKDGEGSISALPGE